MDVSFLLVPEVVWNFQSCESGFPLSLNTLWNKCDQLLSIVESGCADDSAKKSFFELKHVFQGAVRNAQVYCTACENLPPLVEYSLISYEDFYPVLNYFNLEGGFFSQLVARQAVPPGSTSRTLWNSKKITKQAFLDGQAQEFIQVCALFESYIQECVLKNSAAVMLIEQGANICKTF
jgi:hypothetical protein